METVMEFVVDVIKTDANWLASWGQLGSVAEFCTIHPHTLRKIGAKHQITTLPYSTSNPKS